MTVGSADGDSGSDPMFAGPIKNVTVNVGREAVLECHVNNLRGYKVRYSGGSLPSNIIYIFCFRSAG